jgi:RNA polymerase sigma-70 factor (ECF subfamily)
VAPRTDIESFYRDHADSVYAYLVSLSRNRTHAEDLMQDTFIKANRSLAGYRGGSPKAWLFSIARSVFIDDVRRGRDTSPYSDDAPGRSETDVEERNAIERTLTRLPERQRSALLLSDHVGLSSDEVAETMGISPGAARVLIHRGRLAFRTAYDQEGR